MKDLKVDANKTPELARTIDDLKNTLLERPRQDCTNSQELNKNR